MPFSEGDRVVLKIPSMFNPVMFVTGTHTGKLGAHAVGLPEPKQMVYTIWFSVDLHKQEGSFKEDWLELWKTPEAKRKKELFES